jgi:hypothetical protein
MSQTQTPEEYFLSTFTPEEQAVLGDHARTTCVNCGRPFQIDIDDPHRAVCDYCLRVGYDRGRERE